ncbi:MAG: hypothetical protein OEV43_08075, partial [Coriobacteriia bacterium]|nr:hypothetical protein [Coriobacteriia bacterium]
MTRKIVRRNEQFLRWLRAAAFAAGSGWALYMMDFRPVGAAFGLSLGIGALSLMSPGIAVVAAVISLGLPLVAADFLAGVIFLIVGLAAVQYLGQDNGRAFLLIMLAFVGVAFGPLWAAAIIAGYILGPSEGAVTALLACLAVQVAGIVLGQESLGLVTTGGSTGLASFDSMPANVLTFAWVGEALDSIQPQRLLDTLTGINSIAMLIIQPIVWGVGAAVTGLVRRPLDDPQRKVFGIVAGLAGAGTLLVGTAMAYSVAGGGLSGSGDLLTAAASSLLLAVGFIAAWEWIFPPRIAASGAYVQSGMSAEDADVDELLRLIATAEDELASKHTVNAVVMITDMKSFSKMTEEDGSIVSAKTIQRHRDLLLPVIAQHGGHGKSTGGDGLVAAFDSSSEAVRAAITMQRTLEEYNAAHPSE